MYQTISDWVALRPTVLPSIEDGAPILRMPFFECFVNVYRGDHCDIAYGAAVANSRTASIHFAGWGRNKPLYRIKVKVAA